MAFNINEFRAALSRNGVMRQTNYAVNITPPSTLNDSIVREIPLMCDSAQIPGTSFNSDVFRHKGYGLDERRPNGINVEDVSLTFVGDARGHLLKFFDKWGNKIMNSHDNTGPGTERFGYPSEYYGTIELYMYDIAGNKVTVHTYQDAWPVNIGNIQVGWGLNDQVVILPVTFTYRQHLTKLVSQDEYDFSYSEIGTQTNLTSRRMAAIQTALVPPNIPDYLSRLYTIN